MLRKLRQSRAQETVREKTVVVKRRREMREDAASEDETRFVYIFRYIYICIYTIRRA